MSKNQPFVTLDHKKTQSRADKNHILPLLRVSVFIAGTKLSPICSPQMYIRTHSVLMESLPAGQLEYHTPARRQHTTSRFLPGRKTRFSGAFAEELRNETLVHRTPLSTVTQFARLRDATHLADGGLSTLSEYREASVSKSVPLRRCFCDHDFIEKLSVGPVVKAKFVAKTLLDPICVLRTAR